MNYQLMRVFAAFVMQLTPRYGFFDSLTRHYLLSCNAKAHLCAELGHILTQFTSLLFLIISNFKTNWNETISFSRRILFQVDGRLVG